MEGTQKQIVIGLVAVAVLLAAIIGVLFWQNSKTSVPDPTANATDNPTTSPTSNSSTTTAAPSPDFDPATAPKVAAGQTPEDYVKAYYQACQDKKYDVAFPMLPTATQAYYGDEAGFKSTLEGYGVSAFTVQPQKEAGDAITVVGAQTAQGMEFPYTWKFVKGTGDEWLCESRTMGAQ